MHVERFFNFSRIIIYLVLLLTAVQKRAFCQAIEWDELRQRPEEPTEFLDRWDRRYRLFDPQVESSRQRLNRDYAAAAAELKRAVIFGLPDESMYYRLGFCYEKIGDLERAREAYQNAEMCLTKEPGDEFWHYVICYHLGHVHAKAGDYKEAIRRFEKALEYRVNSAEARNDLAYCYSRCFMKRKALRELEKAVTINPRFAEAYLNTGVIQAELGNLKEAEHSLRRALEIEPRIAGARYSLARVLIARGEAQGAEQELRAAIDDFPRDAKAHLELAKLYNATDREERAREEASLALDLMPALENEHRDLFSELRVGERHALAGGSAGGFDEGDLLSRAKMLMSRGDLEGAEDTYNLLLKANPGSARAYFGLGYIHEFQGGVRYGDGFPAKSSIDFYTKALEIEPDMSAAWLNLGNVYEKSGMYGKACDVFIRAKDFPASVKIATYDLGLCYSKLGKRKEAEEQFVELLEMDPDFSDAHFQLGVLSTNSRDYQKAIEEYKTVLAMNPRDGDAHFNLGQIYRSYAGKPLEAMRHFEAYVKLKPDAKDAARVREWIGELERSEDIR
jgi:tetratricopeptide (TPR) repeat protein